MTEQLTKKVNRAVRLIKVSVGEETVEVSYSGGKDSDVILELVRMAGVKYRAIYKNTTIDPPLTHQHCRENGVEIHNPTISFLKLIEKKGFPTRRARFCCEKLKEYKIMDMAVQGIRRNESTARAKRYDPNDPVICRIYGSKKNHVSVILPILEWTDEDVAEFLAERGVKATLSIMTSRETSTPNAGLGASVVLFPRRMQSQTSTSTQKCSVRGFGQGRFGGRRTRTPKVTKSSVTCTNLCITTCSVAPMRRLRRGFVVVCSPNRKWTARSSSKIRSR